MPLTGLYEELCWIWHLTTAASHWLSCNEAEELNDVKIKIKSIDPRTIMTDVGQQVLLANISQKIEKRVMPVGLKLKQESPKL